MAKHYFNTKVINKVKSSQLIQNNVLILCPDYYAFNSDVRKAYKMSKISENIAFYALQAEGRRFEPVIAHKTKTGPHQRFRFFYGQGFKTDPAPITGAGSLTNSSLILTKSAGNRRF
jgi:hypothetical protein